MYETRPGRYDDIPEGMKRYINNYGCHFNRKLCEEAVGRMYYEKDGKVERIKPYTKEQVERLLGSYGIELKRGKMYDAVYVACMAKADFLGSSIPDEKYLALYIRDVLEDVDAEDGYVFNRFYADCMFMDNPIDWDEML